MNQIQIGYIYESIEDILFSYIKDEIEHKEILKKLRLLSILYKFDEEIFNWESAIKKGLLSKNNMKLFDKEIQNEMKNKNVKEMWKFK